MRRRRTNSGYTLLEALVAAVILVIALPFLTRWVLAGRQAQVGSLRSDQATAVAVRVMDSLVQLPRASRPSGDITAITIDGRVDSLKWGYFAGNSTLSYASPSPGAAWVEIHWKAGMASRVSRLEGVLP